MNISGIRPSVGFYDYNEIKRPDLTPDVRVLDDTAHADVNVVHRQPQIPVERSQEVEARQTFGAYDYASQYNPEATYSLKGEESDIHSLDVEKAISDMRKDEVIHQYQYFVGQEMGTNTSPASAMRGVEDFSL